MAVCKVFTFQFASRPAGARFAYSVVPTPAADRRKILNSILWGAFCLTNTLTDAKIQIEEAPPMNGWPRFIVIFLFSNHLERMDTS